MVSLIGKKIGMTQVFDESGLLTPVTVIHIQPNVVIDQRVKEKSGYNAVVVGAIDAKEKNVSKAEKGQYKEGVTPKRVVMEFKNFDGEHSVGDSLSVALLNDLKYVDVIGTSKGKGFQGVMKRHNFAGGPKTHGSKFHREGGSTGHAEFPSKVFKGKKMAGRMGGERKTVQNLELVQVDEEKSLILVKGAVPGAKNSTLVVRSAKKKN